LRHIIFEAKGAKKIPKTFFKTRLETTYTSVFLKYLVVSFRFIEDYFRNLMCWEKSKNTFEGSPYSKGPVGKIPRPYMASSPLPSTSNIN
jgi:hypothetical protein